MQAPKTLPKQDAQANAARHKRILVPITLTEGSRETLALALSRARQSDAEVVLLYVIDLNVPDEELGMSRPRMLSLLRCEAERELTQLVQQAGTKVRASILIREGNPLEVIAQAAKSLAADLITTCTHSAPALPNMRNPLNHPST